MNSQLLTGIDLFAGCGGLSLGLEWAGWDMICAVERSPMAAETYFANFVSTREDVEAEYAEHLSKGTDDQVRSGLLVDDVRAFGNAIDAIRELLNGRDLGLLAGGPPCQGFSLAGRRSPNDPRNSLVWNFLEVVDLLGPKAVLMENVDAIRSTYELGRSTSVLSSLEEALQKTALRHGGYSVARLSLRADHYGVPQRRKRIFLIGIRKDIARTFGIPNGYCWDSERRTSGSSRSMVVPPVAVMPAPTAKDAIWDLLNSRYASIDLAPGAVARAYALWSRRGTVPRPSGLDAREPPNHSFRSHRAATQTRFHLLRLFRERGVPSHIFGLDSTNLEVVEHHLEPLEPLFPLNLPIATVDNLRQLGETVRFLRTSKHSQRALDGDAPSPTITTLPDDLCHFAANRTLTVREMARLQSFPDSFVFRGKVTTGGKKRRTEIPQYTQVGNAVPPILAEALGSQLKRILMPELAVS